MQKVGPAPLLDKINSEALIADEITIMFPCFYNKAVLLSGTAL